MTKCNDNLIYLSYCIGGLFIILLGTFYNFTRIIIEVISRGVKLYTELIKLY